MEAAPTSEDDHASPVPPPFSHSLCLPSKPIHPVGVPNPSNIPHRTTVFGPSHIRPLSLLIRTRTNVPVSGSS